ncbi:MAG: hypothetical protein IAE82_06220 [Opitutaceae bacterium]|nr:hypothetical protein [Opitutaceae bacterium]
MTRKKRGCLIVLVVLVLLATAVVVGVSMFLPGDLRLGGAAPAPAVVSAPATTSAVPGAPAPAAPAPAAGGWFTYVVPGDILEAEVRKAFPIRQNVVDLVRLQLDKPTFLTDPDGTYLRVRLAVEARILDGGQSVPGIATIRTQLAYDRTARRVSLRSAQLVDLSFVGGVAPAAAALQPVLAQALAAELEGYTIFEVPADGLWWLKTGVGFVRDVSVRDGRVCLTLGP